MAGLITGLEPEAVRAATERVREEIAAAARKAGRDPAEVELLAAVKYVALEEMGVLAEAGLTLVGENRAQELEAKATAHPELRWHFIGQLQSRKVKQILPYAELIHSVASDSALRQLETPRHARDGDPRRGQCGGGGGQGRHRPGRARSLHRARSRARLRPHDDAAVLARIRRTAGAISRPCESSPRPTD